MVKPVLAVSSVGIRQKAWHYSAQNGELYFWSQGEVFSKLNAKLKLDNFKLDGLKAEDGRSASLLRISSDELIVVSRYNIKTAC